VTGVGQGHQVSQFKTNAATHAAAVPKRFLHAPPTTRARKQDRPHERLVNVGSASLSDAELFSLFLQPGPPGSSAIDLAHDLLAQFGTLRGVFDAPIAELCTLRGIAPVRAAQLHAVAELCVSALAEKTRERTLLDAPNVVGDYLKFFLGTRRYEVFVCLYLDARNQLLLAEEAARGSVTRVAVYPREIVRRAIALNAAGLIVAHNHPSGSVAPSANDRKLTQTLQDALTLIDVELLDHFVVASNEVFSFARQGWL